MAVFRHALRLSSNCLTYIETANKSDVLKSLRNGLYKNL